MRIFVRSALSVLVLVLSACSKPTPQSQASVQLIVDDKTVLEEKATNKEVAALEKRHLALSLQTEASCWLARFMHESISAGGKQSDAMVRKSGQVVFEPLAADANLSRMLNSNLADHLCPIEREYSGACAHEQRKNSTVPPGDHLQLLHTLQSKYGMKRSAQWTISRQEASADKSDQRESTDVLRMDTVGFSCSAMSSTTSTN